MGQDRREVTHKTIVDQSRGAGKPRGFAVFHPASGVTKPLWSSS